MRARLADVFRLALVGLALVACSGPATGDAQRAASVAVESVAGAAQAAAASAGPGATSGPASAAARRAPAPKDVTVNAFPPPDTFAGREWTYLRETGHYVAGGFKRYLDANGGVGALGFPITEELVEDGWTVQYFQRARLEFHPESPGAPILRALLGDMLLNANPQLREGQAFRPTDVVGEGARRYAETGFAIEPPVLAYFDGNGGAGTLGFPVSRLADGVQWFQRGRLEVYGGTVQAALIGDEYTDAVGLAHARARAEPPRLARADLARVQDDLDVFAAPGGPQLVTRLPQDAQLRVTGERSGPSGDVWYAVWLWNAVEGYVRRDQLAFTPAPDKPPGPESTPWTPVQPPAQGPFELRGAGTFATASDFAAVPGGPAAGRVTAGTRAAITEWATDAKGRVWYRFEASSAAGWALPSVLSLDEAGLQERAANAERVQTLAGKGMWFTYDTVRETPPANLVAAAKANGFTFLAPELGTSRRGYWGDETTDVLLSTAHAAGLKVVPWVYPWLADIPGDLDLALTAARHTSPSGERVDALAVDLEENLDEDANRAFGQLLRNAVGPDAVLIAMTYQPQIVSGRRTAYATLAERFDVIAPMSYWHARPVAYRAQDAHDYVAESVRLVRERVGRADFPVAVIGQTFDWFSRNEIGPNNPTGEEMRGGLQAARDTGALSVGFFNWFSTTPDEWDAIQTFSWQ